MWQQAFRVTAFPLVMVGSVVLASSFMGWGVDPALAPFFTLIAFGLPAIALFERLIPFRPSWNNNHGDVKTDVLNLVFVQILWPKLLTAFWLAALAGATITVAGIVPWSDSAPWPHDWPMLAQLMLALVVAEFGRYWVHRLAHEVSWLWRFHAIHHSPKRLYWLNAARFHPVEKIYLHIPETLPFILLGAGPEVLALYFVVTGIHGFFQHSNIDVKLGPLNYVFAMAELHRFHHSKVIEESNTNYGNNLILWDLIFGTFYWPKDRQVGTIGLLNDEYPEGFLGQISAPFEAGRKDKPVDYAERSDYYHQQAKDEAVRCNKSIAQGESL